MVVSGGPRCWLSRRGGNNSEFIDGPRKLCCCTLDSCGKFLTGQLKERSGTGENQAGN